MPAQSYQSSGWETHGEIKLREIEFPLFEGDPTHFTVLRTFEGPLSTFKAMALNTVDTDFDGSTRTSVAGEESDDTLTFAAAHKLFTGCPVVLSNVSGMSGISAGTYYAIRVSATVIKLASSIANARAGTVSAFTSDGTCDVTLPCAYLVRQSPLRDVEAGCVRYERIFATVPAQWSEPESFAFVFPAFAAGTVGTTFSVTSIAAGSAGQVVISTSATGIAVGDRVYAQVKYTRAGVVYQQGFMGAAIAATSGVSVTLPGNLLGTVGSPSSVSGTVGEIAVGRGAALSQIVGSRLVHDYALSSISALDTDLPVHQVFTPIDSLGAVTDSLSATTIPTNSDYFTLVINGTEIIAECSRHRYLGNIFVRVTRMIPAK